MNIHVSYSVFDSEELLEKSIETIRDSVSEITVIFQKISHTRNTCDPNLESLLRELKDKKLIDNLVLFNPPLNKHPEEIERIKHNLGYDFALRSKCEYNMQNACDHFYFKDEFSKVQEILLEYPVDLVTGYMHTYYKSSSYRYADTEDYVVPILNKVKKGNKYEILPPAPLVIDPAMRMKYESCFCLPKDKPIMHHLHSVRKDFRKKLVNSAASYQWKEDIDRMVEWYENWTPDKDAYLFGKYIKLIKTDRFKEEIKF
jgi:predicted aldo/keto reductase-like oxidoreductase